MVKVGNNARAVEVYHLDDPGGGVVSRLSLGGASGMASEFWTSDELPEYFNFSPKTLGGPTARMILHRWYNGQIKQKKLK